VPGRRGDRLILPTASVASDAKLTGGTVVGEGAFVGEGARIFGSTLLSGRVPPRRAPRMQPRDIGRL